MAVSAQRPRTVETTGSSIIFNPLAPVSQVQRRLFLLSLGREYPQRQVARLHLAFEVMWREKASWSWTR